MLINKKGNAGDMMKFYDQYGFVPAKELMARAMAGRYAVPALNFISMEQINAIVDAMISRNSSAIVMVAPKHCRQFETQLLVRMAQAALERLIREGSSARLALHLDHGASFEDCKNAIDHGFSSVMIDGSGLSLEENMALTQRVVEYAHPYGVTVEGEVGALSGAEDRDAAGGQSLYTQPQDAERFVRETGIDCLAVSVGTMHGLKKTEGNDLVFRGLRYDLIEEISQRIPETPLVLHGCSALPSKYVHMINQYGGRLEKQIGIPDEQMLKASQTAVCKINIASDGWLPSIAITRKVLAEQAETIDSREYRREIREELKLIYEHKMDIFHSSGTALLER